VRGPDPQAFIPCHFLTNYRILGLSHSSAIHHANETILSLSSDTTSISQTTTTTQDIVRKLQETSLDTKNTVEVMNASLSDRIGRFSESLEVILRSPADNAPGRSYPEHNSQTGAIPGPSFGHISCTTTYQCRTQRTKLRISNGQTQRARRQLGYRRVYHLGFATITVTSRSTTTQQSSDPSSDNPSSTYKNISSRTVIDIRPHPWITLRCVLGFINRQFNGACSLNCDARLRP